MLVIVTILILVARIPYGCSVFRVCIPNSQFQWNGLICFCGGDGRWSEANCRLIERQDPCKPGQVVFGNCSQCICDNNGQLLCTDIPCNEYTMTRKPTLQLNYLEAAGLWCTPFRSYYINCTLCTCPASGKTSEAICVIDNSCFLKETPLTLAASNLKKICIPKVIYLFPCLQCLCSDDGYFVVKKCLETCPKRYKVENRRCIPKTFYRKECNTCWCPENGVHSEMLCSKIICKRQIKFQSLHHLENRVIKCEPHTITKPVCFYCNCSTEGNINVNACFENECLKIPNVVYDFAKSTCSPGELLPICMECFCPRNGLINQKYCTSTCSTQNKLRLVENVLADSRTKTDLINWDAIKRATVDGLCTPRSLYIDREHYCLCPDNGNRNLKTCTSNKEIVELEAHSNNYVVNIDFNMTCEAGTFVDFDCNTCYCMKNGKFDPKWCTYDDCNAKKIIVESHKINRTTDKAWKAIQTCVLGTMSKVDCNYCICPNSGLLEERVCTKNDCAGIRWPIHNDKLMCEPLTYYLVDCNICYCPRDGLKNIVKCSKNHCEKSFLRSDTCTPGDLFSDNCNICICPPNGDKSDKVCTNHTCIDADTPWQTIIKISQNLLDNKEVDETARNLDLCFPGEEFVVGCKVCVCPDMGLREYASCTTMLCNEGHTIPENNYEYETPDTNATVEKSSPLVSRRELKSCITYNLTDSSERKECTPGSMYIIRCRQCICPYMGNINHFCRPLPKGFYCEQAFPNFNYMPMGRRRDPEMITVNTTSPTSLKNTRRQPTLVTIRHDHTKYKCDKLDKIIDECFVCDCEDGVLIEEHCFRNDNVKCTDAVPTFLRPDNKIIS